ncbi:hypothetical protein LWI28_006012 [Acer negundo]|uniref:Retrotransposon gag domain-containing protein n=1 Tax=Acer negundo TaxID=4023 RepID=A0AAD5J4Q7_ACENE|nr:hypothetical protein LWI28_006012 [Acer negundo]
MFEHGILFRILSRSSKGYPAIASDRYPVTRSTGYPATISAGYPTTASDGYPDTTSAKKSPQLPARPRGEKKDPQSDSEGRARSRKSPRSRRQEAKRKEVVIDSETSDEEGSVARSENKKSQRLEDQMAQMVKKLEELKKGNHQGIRKNPLEDPISYLKSFVHQMEVQNVTRSAMCRMFLSTLTDCAKTWFRKLPPGCVDSFSKLITAFCAQFQGIKPRPKDPILLQYVIHERGETLRSYMEKFHKEVIQMGVFVEK